MEGLLLAADYASNANIDALKVVFALDPEFFVSCDPYETHSAPSILLALLPEVVDPRKYMHLWVELSSGELSHSNGEIEKIQLPEEVVKSRSQTVQEFIAARCNELGWTKSQSGGNNMDPLSKWLKIRLIQIDNCCGKLEWMFSLMEQAPTDALNWYNGIGNIVYQLRTHYGSDITLQEFMSNNTSSNVERLLEHASRTGSDPENELHKLVLPYLTYNDDWEPLFRWIGNQQNLLMLISAARVANLKKPVMVALYSNEGTDKRVWATMESITADLCDGRKLNETHYNFANEPPGEFTYKALMGSWLTDPTKEALSLLQTLIAACKIFATATPISLQNAVRLRFGPVEHQEGTLISYLEACGQSGSWGALYKNVFFLQETILSRVSRDWLENIFIHRALRASQFSLVAREFAKHPLLEKQVLTAFYEFYDSASNGNQTRGSMRNAANVLALVAPSTSDGVLAARKLLAATHDLSDFTLAFQPGIPARPVEIKEYPPLDIIRRVLELNPKAYNQHLRLVGIAQDLVEGTKSEFEGTKNDFEVQIRAMCSQAALVDDNFQAAYSLCVPALTSVHNSASAWEACLQVGKYVTSQWDDVPPLAILSKQVNILALTLKICPKENITDVLTAWHRLEKFNCPFEAESKDVSPRPQSQRSNQSIPAASHHGQRKRDQISNMLVSGLGWAIGANSE